MIVHIVMIKFTKNTSSQKVEELKDEIISLKNSIKEIQTIEAGINFADEERALDLALIAKFKTKDDLTIYANDKTHQELIAKIKEVAEYTKVVDYEI